MSNRTVARFSPYPDRSVHGSADANMQGRRGAPKAHRSLDLRVVGGSRSHVPQSVYLQSYSQAPIYNGTIVGDVKNFQVYELDKDGLKLLFDHSAKGATHDSGERYPSPHCHPGTRQAVVGRIRGWFGYVTVPKKKIMWVHAPAGYGKTAIAGTISKILEDQNLNFKPLGATFFFWRTSPQRNNPTRFIVTIAYQLAMAIPEFRREVKKAVEKDVSVLGKNAQCQLDALIVKPFKALGGLISIIPTRLVIIDGLDECINSEQESRLAKAYAQDQEEAQRQVLELIHTLQSHHLPLCFLILSRPEPWIRKRIETWSEDVVEVVDLYRVGDHMNDVEKYVRAELSRIAAEHDELVGDEEWPEENIVQHFVQRTDGHMVYASTVIRHIDDPYHDPRERLANILNLPSDSNPDLAHSTSFSSLYELYRQIMRSCPESSRLRMIEVLEDMVTGPSYFPSPFKEDRVGFPFTALDSLSGREAGSGARAVRSLHAVLRVEQGHIRSQPFIHSSFVQFLTNPILSLEFAVDKKKAARRMLWNCLKCMSMPWTQRASQDAMFAIQTFTPLWVMAWSSAEDVRLREEEYLEVVKKLLTIDLTVRLTDFFEMEEFSSKYIEPEFLASLEHLPKESDPLAQQAIMHVLTAVSNATVRNLSATLRRQFRDYLNSLRHRSETSNQHKSHQVVQALNSLGRELEKVPHPPRPGDVAVGWSLPHIPPILDYIRQNDL